MTAQAGAVLDQPSTWEALNWRSIENEVRRLQVRIVKAVQKGRWNKAKALQRLLDSLGQRQTPCRASGD